MDCGAQPIWEDKVFALPACNRTTLWSMDTSSRLHGVVLNHGAGAARETREEAEAEVEIEQLYCTCTISLVSVRFTYYSNPN